MSDFEEGVFPTHWGLVCEREEMSKVAEITQNFRFPSEGMVIPVLVLYGWEKFQEQEQASLFTGLRVDLPTKKIPLLEEWLPADGKVLEEGWSLADGEEVPGYPMSDVPDWLKEHLKVPCRRKS